VIEARLRMRSSNLTCGEISAADPSFVVGEFTLMRICLRHEGFLERSAAPISFPRLL
jgi:hypothetical protein